MINNDAAILQHYVEEWEKIIPEWVDEHKQNLTARNILHRRDVSAAVTIDVVEKYDKTGPGAQITAKGAVPKTFGISTKNEKFEIHQIGTGFNINKKDLTADASVKSRLIEIGLSEIHEKEDDISGNDINNKGKWAGETGTDIFTDVSDGIGFMDSKFKAAFLVGNSKDMRYIFHKDSERNMYYEDMGILFGKTDPKDTSWIWQSDYITRGKVYIVCKDTMAADFVVSEDPGIVTYPMGPGQNYPVELYSWSETEIYANEAFVEIEIT
jgi:hypothetical protein